MVTYWQALGAAVATLITESVIATLMLFLAKDVIDKKRILHAFLRYAICGTVVFIGATFTGKCINAEYAIVLQIFVGCLIYVLLLIMTKDPILAAGFQKVNSFSKGNRL